MMRNRLVRSERLLRAEDGQALILALIVVMVVSIAAVSTVGIVTSTQNHSTREREGARAFSGGEAGLDIAANAVVDTWNGSATLPTDGTQLPSAGPGSATVDGNSVQWRATYIAGASGAPGAWRVTSTTVSPNGKVTRVLSGSMEPSTSTVVGEPSTIWGYGFVMGGAPQTNATSAVCALSTTTSIGGSGEITVPTWINGDVCLIGGSDPAIGNPATGAAIPVHIGGALFVDGNNWGIGTPTNHVASANVLGGCWSAFHGWHTVPCDSNAQNANNGGSGVYATDFHPTEASPTPAKPLLDSATEQSRYDTASPGPVNACTTGSTGSTFRFDSVGSTTPDTSLGSKNLVTFLGASAWDCQTASGRLKWTPGVPAGVDGTLYVSGTVFIDASLTMGGADYIKWDGRGSIYVDGTITLTNDGSICAVYSSGHTCDFTNWTPATDAADSLVFFAAYNRSYPVTTYGFDMQGNSRFQGIAYANGGFHLANSSVNAGSVFADFGLVSGAGKFQVTTDPPSGALGSDTTTTVNTWSVAPRSWRECPSAVGCS